jgi:hypothetical protein
MEINSVEMGVNFLSMGNLQSQVARIFENRFEGEVSEPEFIDQTQLLISDKNFRKGRYRCQ